MTMVLMMMIMIVMMMTLYCVYRPSNRYKINCVLYVLDLNNVNRKDDFTVIITTTIIAAAIIAIIDGSCYDEQLQRHACLDPHHLRVL
jgi:hypothetical protein